MSEGIFIPENIDVLLFGEGGEIGTLFKETLISNEVPLFAPNRGLIDLHHAEYVKMLVEGLKPQTLINCASYSGEDKEIINHTNSVVPFNLSQICYDLDVAWMHVIRDHPAESPLAEACEKAVTTIQNSKSKCYLCKIISSPEEFVPKCLALIDNGDDYGTYEL
tara:strand:- start:28 stop:519 length:492 start_codon:yes stop_codon:yes gene_type:complete